MYETSKDLRCKKEKTKFKNVIKQYEKWLTLMLQKNKWIKDYNSNWPQLSDYPYRLLTIGGSGSGKIN